ncbi:MAG: isoprenylcysteine carboxylmethyltransferase family protein [Vulcanimicrobiota bacterium]
MGSLMYAFLVIAVALQRVMELQISRSNEAHLRRKGAVEHGAGHYPLMVALHALWLVACLAEWWTAPLALPWGVCLSAWVMFLAGQYLRWATIRTLRRRWTTRVLVLEGVELVAEGPFRHLNHPNYLGVSLEIAALPLIGGCWRTALVFGVLNLLLLCYRIRVEDRALR